jgi:hypothetical protein
MITELTEALQLLIESSLSDINTSVPGKIISYDAARNRAIVVPILPKSLSGGDTLAAPKIVEVPVVWPAHSKGKGSFTMPLEPGDGVMLSFQQRSLEGWLDGNEAAPSDPRQFDLSDCVAIPGLFSEGTVADPKDIVLKFDKTSLTLTHDNKAIIGNDKATITLTNDGGVIINAQYVRMQNPSGNGYINIDTAGAMSLVANTISVTTPAKSFVMETHRHDNVQSGSGTSGQPL